MRVFSSPLRTLLALVLGAALLPSPLAVVADVGQLEVAVGTDPGHAAIVPAGEVREVITLLFGESTIVDGEVADLISAAETIAVNGGVRDNALLACESATIPGVVGGDLLFLGETATITGGVEGDVYFWGRTLIVAPGGTVRGNVIGGGESILIRGAVGGDVKAFAGRLELAGSVGRGVNASVAELVVLPGATVGGDLRYTTPEPVEIPPGTVAGSVTHEPPSAAESSESGIGLVGALLSHGALYFGTLLLGIFLLRLCRPVLLRPAAALAASPVRAIAFGFIGAIVLTAICALGALFTAGGLAVGSAGRLLAIGGVLLAPFWLAVPVTALCAGEWLHRRSTGRTPSDIAALASGLLFLQILGAVPFIGGLVAIGVGCAGIGGMFLAARGGSAELAGPVTVS
jgi:cytoskeletal protein CcmA (bactofilin family)